MYHEQDDERCDNAVHGVHSFILNTSLLDIEHQRFLQTPVCYTLSPMLFYMVRRLNTETGSICTMSSMLHMGIRLDISVLHEHEL